LLLAQLIILRHHSQQIAFGTCMQRVRAITFLTASASHFRRWRPSVTGIVVWYTALLYVASLSLSLSINQPSAIGTIDTRILLLFGAAGSFPVFEMQRWWTPFTAAFLCSDFLILIANVLLIRQFASGLEVVFGPARHFIVFTASGAFGFLVSSLVGIRFPALGAVFTVGPGGPLVGTLAGAYVYGLSQRSAEGRLIAARAAFYASLMLVLGLLSPGHDTIAWVAAWCAGYVLSRFFVAQTRATDPTWPTALAVTLGVLILAGHIASVSLGWRFL
jgi:membrane associated rhomboid family serine protease